MGKNDCGRSVYTSSRDVTASGSTQDVASRQGEQADCNYEKTENNGYLQVFNSHCETIDSKGLDMNY